MEGGPPCFAPGFTCPALLGIRLPRGRGSAYGALTRSGRPSHAVPLPRPFSTGSGVYRPPVQPSRNPRAATPCRCAHARVWAPARSLAATSAISLDFSSSGYLDVSVPRVASRRPMYSGGGSRDLPLLGCPIRRSAGQSLCAARRGLSQLVTSFFDFLCQGIHRAPLVSSSSRSLLQVLWVSI